MNCPRRRGGAGGGRGGFEGTCYDCGETGHLARQCRMRNRGRRVRSLSPSSTDSEEEERRKRRQGRKAVLDMWDAKPEDVGLTSAASKVLANTGQAHQAPSMAVLAQMGLLSNLASPGGLKALPSLPGQPSAVVYDLPARRLVVGLPPGDLVSLPELKAVLDAEVFSVPSRYSLGMYISLSISTLHAAY